MKIIWKKAPNEEINTNETASDSADAAQTENAAEAQESKEVVKETIIVSSPITGIAADLATAPDDAFAGRMMGDGAVVTPTSATIVAPEDGQVIFVFDTKQCHRIFDRQRFIHAASHRY